MRVDDGVRQRSVEHRPSGAGDREFRLGHRGPPARLLVGDDVRPWVDGAPVYALSLAPAGSDTFPEHRATAIRDALPGLPASLPGPFPVRLRVAPDLPLRDAEVDGAVHPFVRAGSLPAGRIAAAWRVTRRQLWTRVWGLMAGLGALVGVGAAFELDLGEAAWPEEVAVRVAAVPAGSAGGLASTAVVVLVTGGVYFAAHCGVRPAARNADATSSTGASTSPGGRAIPRSPPDTTPCR